jgi:hypothetical protein
VQSEGAIRIFSYELLVAILPFQRLVAFGIVTREKHNVTKRYIATINVQLHNASTKASVVALVRSCGSTELHKAANIGKTTVLSSSVLLKKYFNN